MATRPEPPGRPRPPVEVEAVVEQDVPIYGEWRALSLINLRYGRGLSTQLEVLDGPRFDHAGPARASSRPQSVPMTRDQELTYSSRPTLWTTGNRQDLRGRRPLC